MNNDFVGLKFVNNEHGGFNYDLYLGYFDKFIKRFSNMWEALQYVNKLNFRVLYYNYKEDSSTYDKKQTA